MPRIALLALAAFACATAGRAATPERLDEASVRAAETRWSEAFVTGDAATLEALLASDYVSVNPAGKARPKAEIIAVARAYAAKNPGQHAQPLTSTSTVELIGTAALVHHHAPTDVSIDLFEFKGGHWLARYSQHTAVPPAA
jgi:ketosteroid isomerase-like protein